MDTYTVLIPLDGSDFSRRILGPVRRFLPPEWARLILYQVVRESTGLLPEPPRPATPDVDVPMYESHADINRAHHPIYTTQEDESRRAQILAQLEGLRRSLEVDGYQVQVEVGFGEDPAEEIVNFVRYKDVDLVAMTTHGRSGLSKLLFGSVAEEVFRRVNVPVLLLRPFED